MTGRLPKAGREHARLRDGQDLGHMIISLVLLAPYMIHRHNQGRHVDKPSKVCWKCFKAHRTNKAAVS